MIAEPFIRPYRVGVTITRIEAFAAGFDGEYLNGGALGRVALWDFAKAREILTQYPGAIAIDFTYRQYQNPDGLTRYNPPPGYIVYVKSSGESGGRKRIIRYRPIKETT